MATISTQASVQNKVERPCVLCGRKSPKIFYFSKAIIEANITNIFFVTITLKIVFSNHTKGDQYRKKFYARHFFCSDCQNIFHAKLIMNKGQIPLYQLTREKNTLSNTTTYDFKIYPEVADCRTSFLIKYEKTFRRLNNFELHRLRMGFWDTNSLITMIENEDGMSLGLLKCLLVNKVEYQEKKFERVISADHVQTILKKLFKKKLLPVDFEAFYYFLISEIKERKNNKKVTLMDVKEYLRQYLQDTKSSSSLKMKKRK